MQERQKRKELEQLARYRKVQASKTIVAQKENRGSQTNGGRGFRYLIVPVLAAEIQQHDDWIASRPHQAGVAVKQYRKVSKYISAETIAHITISVVLDKLGRGYSLGATFTEVVLAIGRQVEDDAFMAYMALMDENYFKKLKGWYLDDPVRRYDKKVYAMQRALEKHAIMEWEWLTEKELGKLGGFLFSRLSCIRASADSDMGLFEIRSPDFNDPNKPKRKKNENDARRIGFSPIGIQRRDELQKAADEMNWKPMPMVCPPIEWTMATTLDEEKGEVKEVFRGGYINRMPGISKELIHNNKGSEASPMVLEALNRLQRTGYKVNTYILEVQQEMLKGTYEVDGFVTYEKVSYEEEKKPIYDSEWLDTLDTESDEYKAAMLELTKFYKNQKIEEKKAANPRRTVALADEFKDEEAIYTPWYLDNRGRLYPVVEGLSPQGPDFQKALLRSSVSVPVNEDTRRDLLISISTACGETDEEGIGLDKKDYWTRLQWAEEFLQTPYARAMVDYPMDYTYWMEDKIAEPFQFLAFCKEYFDIFVDEVKTTCDVFVFRDATTSGLQILAGLMRDEKSALYTNVILTEEPMDAYRLVADKAKELLRDPVFMDGQFLKRTDLVKVKNVKRPEDDPIPERGTLFEFDIDVLNRAHTKTQVMTTLYNSSPLTRRENILSALKKKNQIELHPGDKGIVVASCITAMSEEFAKALELNTWFQDVARAAMEAGKEHLKWLTPSGMYVVNEYREPLFSTIQTYAAGGGHYAKLMKNNDGTVYLRTGWGDTKTKKVLSSTSANYIHSLDASIIVLGVLDVPQELPVFTVHDCIAAVPGTLSEVIPVFRKAFHNVVTSNPLMGLLEENELDDVLTIPEQGDADISQCLDSPYMFS